MQKKVIKHTCSKCGFDRGKNAFIKRGQPLEYPLICIQCKRGRKLDKNGKFRRRYLYAYFKELFSRS